MLGKLVVACLWVCWLVMLPGTGKGAEGERQLRLGLLAITEVMPVHVAEMRGYFAEMGITVETLPVGSAMERDQLMQAGRIDGMINDMVSVASFNRDGVKVRIVSIAGAPVGRVPLLRVLIAPGMRIDQVSDLAGVPIGISMNTVIEYITTRLLQASGLPFEKISFQSVPVMPERLQLLLSGQLKTATLPDPLAASAIKSGATELVNDVGLAGVSASVVSFAEASLVAKPEVVRAFMAAWDRACGDLNSNPAAYQGLLLEKIRVPKNVEGEYRIPPMPRRVVPSKAQWDDVMAWMLDKKLLSAPLPYEASVTAEFLAR